MSRPLTGSITANRSRGTFTASLPAGIPGKRRTATFETRRQAEAWIADGIGLLNRGEVLPPPRRSRRANQIHGSRGTAFITVAQEHIRERYVEDDHGDVDREQQVTGYAQAIDDYLSHHHLVLETITRQDARAMWQHMLKRGRHPARWTLLDGLDPEELVTKRRALALLAAHGSPVSEATFKRALFAGRLAAADTTARAHLFRVGDLFSTSAGLARSTRAVAEPPHRGRFAYSTLVDVRRIFRAVIEHAEADGIRVAPGVRGAKIPRDKTPKVRARALTLAEAARLATRLHAVHQLVLWLLVLLGLRISEAYGILADDLIDNGPGRHGIVIIQSQGGRRFRHRNTDGTVATSTRVDQTKGRRSNRVLVVPTSLMDLIREVIAVFHTDQHGVRRDARLIPGLSRRDEGGQSAFRNALTRAGTAEDIDITFETATRSADPKPRVSPTPQKLRQSYATSHRADLIPIEDIRATLGQGLGDSVLHTNYLIDDVGLKASRRIAEETQKQLEADLHGNLFIPTAVRCTTGRQPALAARAEEIDARLIDAGWLTSGGPAGDWFTVADAAACCGVTEHQVRDDIRTGALAATAHPRPDQGGSRYLISADAIAAYDGSAGQSELAALADELGLPYDTVRHFVGRNPDLELQRTPGQRNGVLSPADVEFVRQHFREQAELHERAVRLIDVARELGISVAAINTLIRRGQLDEDDRFHGGYRSLTRTSVEQFRESRRPGRRRA